MKTNNLLLVGVGGRRKHMAKLNLMELARRRENEYQDS